MHLRSTAGDGLAEVSVKIVGILGVKKKKSHLTFLLSCAHFLSAMNASESKLLFSGFTTAHPLNPLGSHRKFQNLLSD